MATMARETRVAQLSSAALRFLCYFFLRWVSVPNIPPIVYSLLAVNIPAVVYSYRTELAAQVAGEEVDIVVTDTEHEVDGARVQVEETTVTDSIVLRQPRVSLWSSLVLGTPGPSKLLTALVVLVNAVLVAFVADRVYTEHALTAADLSFVRIGYVSDAEAHFLLREPDQARMPVTLEYRLKAAQPPFESPNWLSAGGARWTDNATDFTFSLTAQLPYAVQRVYEWRTSNGHAGEFTAAPKAGKTPDLFGGRFTFLSTSCILQRVPYSPLDHTLAIPGLRHLARLLPQLNAQFMLFLGDFIYADVPRYWGADAESYRQKYRQVYASPDWPAVGQNLSWIHVLDDHEIKNDWSANTTGVYSAAVDPWHHYHTAVNPPHARQAGTRGLRQNATYFSFAQGPASFFLLDTRTYRSSNSLPANSTDKTMLGPQQLDDLLAYLRRPEPRGIRWKVVASSVPFTKNWRVNGRDTWGGFLAERQTVLEAMWDAGLHGIGVVVLSGDRHEFGATRFPPPADSRWPQDVAVHEFSASPLNQFFSPVPTYFQQDEEDVKLSYINWGNSKFGAITIESDSVDAPSSLDYRLFIDGKQAWNMTIFSPEMTEKPSSSIWDKLLGY